MMRDLWFRVVTFIDGVRSPDIIYATRKSSGLDQAVGVLKDPVLPIVHCTLRSLGGHFCDVENSEAFVCDENRTL